MRKSANEIPKFEELKKIISLESSRRVPNTKLYKRYFDLNPILQLLSFFSISDKFDEIEKISEYLIWSENSKLLLISSIQDLSVLPQDLIEILNDLYSYLSTEDKLPLGLNVDTIFVFGSASTLRIQKAVELYKLGFGKTITVSGKKPFYKDLKDSEADVLANFAIDSGVPESNIIIENRSISLPDNVKRTLDLWEETNFKAKNIIIVCTPFAMRRANVEWLKFPDIDLQIYRQNSLVGEKYNYENWYKTVDGLNIVLNEYFKLQGEYLVDISLAKFGELR